jgi:capsular polysaccharide biosynthesis protein
LLPSAANRTVVILSNDSVEDGIIPFLQHFAADRLNVISVDASPEWRLETFGGRHHSSANLAQTNALLRQIGPVDVLIDLMAEPAEDHDTTWARLFFHLRPGGVYVIPRWAIINAEPERGQMPHIVRVATLLSAGPQEAGDVPRFDRELVRAARTVVLATDAVLAVKRTKHYLKVRDAEAGRIVGSRSDQLTAVHLATLPAREFISRAAVTSHDSSVPIVGMDSAFKVPAAYVREYHGKIALVSNGLLFSEYSILPESFRHPSSTSLRNTRIVDVSNDFARIAEQFRPTRGLAGTYYHLDSSNSGHFGHLMTEVVSRLWGWDVAKARIPDLKAIFRIRFPNERDPWLERRIFSAYGIPAGDIVWVDEPVWLEAAVGATPMWHNQHPHWVHPEIAQIWARLRDGIANVGVEPRRRVFVSRPIDRNRACRNTAEVECYFTERGFDVVYPERLDLSDQAGIFAQAEVVAGFGGSALFNLMFSQKLSTLIVLSHEAYTARNEHLFASVLGCDSHYFWSTPDVSHPPGGWSEEAYYSSWEFDFDRNRGPLDKLLDSVDYG